MITLPKITIDSATEPLCLEHFLATQRIGQKSQTMANDLKGTASSNPAVPTPTRRQPTRIAKKPTDFYELENPSYRTRSREDFEESEAEDYRHKKMPMKRRRALWASNYDVDLDKVPVRDRAYEITWAATMLKHNTESPCCFADQVVVCRECELKRHRLTSNEDEAASSPPKKRIKLVGRLAEQQSSETGAFQEPRKKRIKLVGRLAEQAVMQAKKVHMSKPLQWDKKGCAKPFMMIRSQGQYFAVDYCNDLVIVPLQTVLPCENLQRLLFGRPKNYIWRC